ncbi:hypothetical protein BS17DRAFT_798040 [Gyrodon lividus]|nr:hypothetical protein BS17DRAFT_798040 [Gyrodon lividus]
MDEDEKSGIALDATVVTPHLISKFEKVYYWHGISVDPPELLYCLDLKSNLFPVHPPGTRWSEGPIKTTEGVFGMLLNVVWHIIAPMIIALFKKCGIKHSALKTAHFSTRDEDGKKTLSLIVVWIATHPHTTSTENAHEASPNILHILEKHKVKGAVVEWYEGSMEKLSVRRPFTAVLGMPIAIKEREEADAQGSVSFFFHEERHKNGEPSARVLAISNKHVLRKDTTVDYQFMGSGTPCQYCSTNETRALVTKNVAEAVWLAEEITRLEAKPKSKNEEQAEEDEDALEIKKGQLNKVNRNNIKLQAISIDVDDCHYTRDIGMVELNSQKFKDNFQGNIIDLGNKFTSHKLNTIFWPNNSDPSRIKFPSNGLLRIQGVVKRKLLATPDCFDKNRDPLYIIGKDGNTTNFMVGCYSGLEVYLCDEFGKESIEVAVYNYNKMSGNFSTKGNLGSLIFTGNGHMLTILHSGMPKGSSSHVTYGTPAWWAVEQLQGHYPHADFNCMTY